MFLLHAIQVEVKIDSTRAIPKDKIFANFTVEAGLYDTGSWYNSDGCADLLSSKVADLLVNSSFDAILGFLGYVLVGKLEKPNLWSAEQVSNSISFCLTNFMVMQFRLTPYHCNFLCTFI